MQQIVHATYDGRVLRPEEPLDLPPDTRVEITIQSSSAKSGNESSYLFFRVAESLNVDLPENASQSVKAALYGNQSGSQH